MLLELPLLSRIRREKSEGGRLSSPTGAKRESNNYVESFDKAAIRTNTKFYTVGKHLIQPWLGICHFPGVWILRKRFGLSVYCWK